MGFAIDQTRLDMFHSRMVIWECSCIESVVDIWAKRRTESSFPMCSIGICGNCFEARLWSIYS